MPSVAGTSGDRCDTTDEPPSGCGWAGRCDHRHRDGWALECVAGDAGSRRSQWMHREKRLKTYAKAIIGLSSVGALNALYLTTLFVKAKWGTPTSSVCDINATTSCTAVITSPYALFLGVPVCSIALIVYPLLIALGVAALKRRKTRDLFYAASILSAMGLMLNVVYVYNELVHIGAVCVLCVGCTVLIALDLLASIRGYQLSTD
jgi:uncharacterized membrane protein